MSSVTLNVGDDAHKERLDVFLTKSLQDVPSRTFVKKLIDAGAVRLNGAPVKAHHKIHAGDTIDVEMELPNTDNEPVKAENIPLNIFYEDESFLVVHKPVGMLVHPATGTYTGTLVNALRYHCQSLSNANSPTRPGIIHRLDQATSGLIVIAKTNKVHADISRQFQQHKVEKNYIAVVEGQVEFDEGVIDEALTRDVHHREKKAVSQEKWAKAAYTRYRVRTRSRNRTLIDLYPKTGRTHQLRVHMQHIGHPILGDDKYGDKQNFPRLALHALGIALTHPATGCRVEFRTRVPEEFLKVFR